MPDIELQEIKPYTRTFRTFIQHLENIKNQQLSARLMAETTNIMQGLLRQANLDSPLDTPSIHSGISLLMFAVGIGKTQLAIELIKHGACIDLRCTNNKTALHIATEHNNTEVVSELITAGANVDLQNSLGETALHVAADIGNKKITALLIAGHANPNIRNKSGSIPLLSPLSAIARGSRVNILQNYNIVDQLIDANSDISIKNKRNISAVTIAKRSPNLAVARKIVRPIYNRKRRIAFLSGLHKNIGQNSSLQTINNSSIFDKNILPLMLFDSEHSEIPAHDVTEILEELQPKKKNLLSRMFK